MTRRVLAWFVTVLVAGGGSARAQAIETGNVSVGASGGVTFGTNTSGAGAARAGVALGSPVVLFGEVGRIGNVMPIQHRHALAELADVLRLELGAPVTLQVEYPATYGVAGLRWTKSGTGWAPFVEGGMGAAQVRLKFHVIVDPAVEAQADEPLPHEDAARTRKVAFVGGGFRTSLSNRTAFDVGYRYTHIFVDNAEIHVNQIAAGLTIFLTTR